jgi:hypothetical protein
MTTGVTVVTGAVEGFDYAGLDVETRIVVQQRTGEIRSLVRRSAQDISDIGLKLIEVKERLGHGHFGTWLDSEFGWSEMTARRFMQVYERFKSHNLFDLDVAPSALYLLAAPSTSDEAVEEALERAAGGERISHATAKGIVEEHRPAAASSQDAGSGYASGLPVLDLPGANGGDASAPVEERGTLWLRWRPAAAPEGWDAEDEREYQAVLAVWQQPALEVGIVAADAIERVRVAQRLAEERRDNLRFTLERRMWELVRRDRWDAEAAKQRLEKLAGVIVEYLRKHFVSQDAALQFLIERSGYAIATIRQSAQAQGIECDRVEVLLAIDLALPMAMRTEWPAKIDTASVEVDPWVAAWTQRQYDTLTDRCQRLAVAMLDWGRAWTDDRGRTWFDVVDRNPQHANSPFRQELAAECERRGLSVFDEGMAETIRRLFGLLVESDNLLLSDGGAGGDADGDAGETLTVGDLAVMQAAPEMSAEPEWEVDGDRPLPAWVSAWADGGPAPADVAAGDAGAETAGAEAPVSLRDGYDGDEWYTPGWVIEAARRVMGEIDLDPASCEMAQEVVQAGLFWAKGQDGCRMGWFGRVWLNPPYSAPGAFVEKLIEEYAHGNVRQAIVLLNNSTETRWFQRLLGRFPVCFFSQRLAFWRHDHADVGARQGQAVFYLGQDVEKFCEVFGEFGIVVRRVD